MYQLYITKTDNFLLSKTFRDFQAIFKGEIIGTDGQEIVAAPKDSVILFPNDAKKVGSETFLLGENKKDPAQ